MAMAREATGATSHASGKGTTIVTLRPPLRAAPPPTRGAWSQNACLSPPLRNPRTERRVTGHRRVGTGEPSLATGSRGRAREEGGCLLKIVTVYYRRIGEPVFGTR